MSRRHFLGALGAGAVAAGSSGAVLLRAAHAQQSTRPSRFVIREDRFGRMFPQLEPFFSEANPRLLAALREIGMPGGMLDARDALDRGPVALIVDPALSVDNPNNTAHTAGTTFMGQFLDHDMTFDLTSRLGKPAEPLASPNARTPALDLDSVYGGGPLADPELYVPVDARSRERPTRLRIEHGGLFEDLPRNGDGSAIIADPRNDENLVIAGLQAAFILFHNKAVDLVARDRRESSEDVFRKARQLTTWHYQWIIVHELLPLFIGQPLVTDILRNGRKSYRPEVGFMPVEFQGAAYRFGHTLVRPSYRANLKGDVDAAGQPAPFFAMIFDPAAEGQADPIDLRGGARARRRFIGWQTFFDFGLLEADGIAPAVKPNKLIDTRISTPLFNLPLAAIASGDPPTALPQRNLLRHVTWSLPSGQSIARLLRVPALSGADFPELKGFRLGLEESTPLWYYILKEGAVMANGLHLGPAAAIAARSWADRTSGRPVRFVVTVELEVKIMTHISQAAPMVDIQDLVDGVRAHALYAHVRDERSLRLLMRSHVFAVWDFQSLLKALQRMVTCLDVPWLPTSNPESRRFINEIVLDEESDDCPWGGYLSHFELYRRAMAECGADTRPIDGFIGALAASRSVDDALEISGISPVVQTFVSTTLDIARSGAPHLVAAAFSYGREDIIPQMFEYLVASLVQGNPSHWSTFHHYLVRHIESDGSRHGPMARNLVARLCESDATLRAEAQATARRCLSARLALWDQILADIHHAGPSPA